MAMLIENDLILASSVLLFNAELTQIASEIIKLSRAERWQEIADIMERHETKWMKGLKVRFTDQEAEVNRNIDIYLVPLYPDSLKGIHWTAIHKAVDDLLFDKEKWDIIFSEFGQLLLPGIVGDAGQRGLASLGLDLTFNIRNPRVTEFIDNKKFKFAQEVNQTTLENLRQQLREGVFNGEGIPQLRRRVKDVFDEARTWRTAMIARTETGGAYNFGAFESYRQSRVVQMKEWLATKDMRTRDSHRSIDGERQPLESKFSNGLMYPSDPNGPADEVINCRCTIIGIPVEQIIGGGEQVPIMTAEEARLAVLNTDKGEREKAAEYDRQSKALAKKARAAYKNGDLKLESELRFQSKEYAQKRLDTLDNLDAKCREVIYFNKNGFDLNANFERKIDAKRIESIKDGINEFTKFIDPDILKNSDKYIKAWGLPENGRAYSNGTSIYLAPKDEKWVTVHEMGHWLEEESSNVRMDARAFLQYRTKNEKEEWLGDHYDKKETTKKDKFMHPYMGKQYKVGGVTEITSMGIQYMYEAPQNLAFNDPEYFNFIYDLLRGKQWQSPSK